MILLPDLDDGCRCGHMLSSHFLGACQICRCRTFSSTSEPFKNEGTGGIPSGISAKPDASDDAA